MQSTAFLTVLTDAVRGRLRTYEISLQNFGQPCLQKPVESNPGSNEYLTSQAGSEANDATYPMVLSLLNTTVSHVSETELQGRLEWAYGAYLTHVLHTLLDSPWDPTELFDERDDWAASPSFLIAATHAVAAAEAAGQVLDLRAGLYAIPLRHIPFTWIIVTSLRCRQCPH